MSTYIQHILNSWSFHYFLDIVMNMLLVHVILTF